MNYRHAFHAGNFADVMKHALLVRILAYLQRKETPLRVIDTHAGIGLYDLTGDEAGRTGEWIEGIGRLDEALAPEAEEILAPYRKVIADVRARYGETIYPGSPGIVREILRRQDRGVFVELHPADHAVLSEVVELRAPSMDRAMRRLQLLGAPTTILVLRWFGILSALVFRRFRQLLVFLGAILFSTAVSNRNALDSSSGFSA